MKYNKLTAEIKKSRLTKIELAKLLGVTRQWFPQLLKQECLSVEQLEKLSEVLNLPMSYWWSDDSSPSEKKLTKYQTAIASITSDFEQKYVSKLQENIDDLKSQIKELKKDKDDLRAERDELKQQILEIKSDKLVMQSNYDLLLEKHGISKVGS